MGLENKFQDHLVHDLDIRMEMGELRPLADHLGAWMSQPPRSLSKFVTGARKGALAAGASHDQGRGWGRAQQRSCRSGKSLKHVIYLASSAEVASL